MDNIDEIKKQITKNEVEVKFLERALRELESSHKEMVKTITDLNNFITKLDQILTSKDESSSRIEDFIYKKITEVEKSLKEQIAKVENSLHDNKNDGVKMHNSQDAEIKALRDDFNKVKAFMYKVAGASAILAFVISISDLVIKMMSQGATP